jgi:hypothetical protein
MEQPLAIVIYQLLQQGATMNTPQQTHVDITMPTRMHKYLIKGFCVLKE